MPFVGDLETADIFVLMLNPGYGGLLDHYAEYERPEWRSRVVANLRHDVAGREFPNMYLDPTFCWTGGYQWWTKKLAGITRELATQIGCRNALKELSTRIACIELVPYHSKEFHSHKVIDSFASARLARAYVTDVLLPRVRRGEVSLIVTRQVASWGLDLNEKVKGLIVYEGAERRGANLGPDTKGGREILRRLRPPGSAIVD